MADAKNRARNRRFILLVEIMVALICTVLFSSILRLRLREEDEGTSTTVFGSDNF